MGFSDILMFIVYILAGLLFLTVLVVAHESGHYFVGKKCGIGIVEFSAGMGPKIISKVKNGIRYSLRALPIGGYVQFVGEDEDDPNPKAFNNRPIWQRFLTILAGPAMNIIFAIVITLIALLGFGDYSPYVGGVMEGTPAYEVGLKTDDRIAYVNGKKLDFYTELELSSNSNLFYMGEDGAQITVERSGEFIDYFVPYTTREDGTKLLGIEYIAPKLRHFGFFESISLSFKWMYLMIAELIKVLGQIIFMGKGAENLMGPVGTASYVGKTIVTYGGWAAMQLASMVGINLAVVNILPFPGLDGGRLVFLGLEKLTGNHIPKKVEGIINFIGLVLLIGLVIVLTVQDFSRGIF